MSAHNDIRVEGLVVTHPTAEGTITALDHVNLVVEGGSSLAVMGPSGCGKSTLLGVLAGLAPPTRGQVHIGSTNLTALSERARTSFRRAHIGVVYQADNLLPFLTVTENLLLPLSLRAGRSTRGDSVTNDRRPRVQKLLARLGLEEFEDRLPDELSGGQRQRVAVARAVVHEPSLILADEPTGALDEVNARGVVELLSELQRALDATLVMVTHDPAVARIMARTVMLRNGLVIDSGEACRAR